MQNQKKLKSVSYAKWGYLFILPFFLSYAVFSLIPLADTIRNSFYEYYAFGLKTVGPNWTGLSNYISLLSSDLPKYAWNTFVMWILGFVPQIVISLILASWFTDARLKIHGKQFFKVVIYLPNLIMASAFAMLFFALFSNAGPINNILLNMGVIGEAIRFMESTLGARTLVGLMNFLMWFGNTTIMLMAAIMGINPAIFEAAELDGCTHLQKFFQITLPQIKPLLTYTLITSLIGGLQMFDVPQILTAGKGAPDRTTMTLIMYLNKHLQAKNYGIAGALSVFLFIISAILCWFVFKMNTDSDPDGSKSAAKRAKSAAQKGGYPFGFGLSYTRFALEVLEAGEENGTVQVQVRVTNTGDRAGKEVIQLYFCPPKGLLQKPSRNLAAFKKTGLLNPGESETVTLSFAAADMASFDDLGKIAPSVWALEKGRYALYLGTSVRNTEELAFAYEQADTEIVRQCGDVLAPSHLAKRLQADGTWEDLPAAPAVDTDANALEPLDPNTLEAVAPAIRARDRYLLSQLYPEGVRPLSDVAKGKLSLDTFMNQLSDEDLIHLLGGQPNAGVSNTFGIGNLPEYGVPNITTADGPAGLRIQPEVGVYTTAWPCATLLAASWDEDLVSKVGAAAAAEVKENNIDLWLAPALNIHRSPLCGRNFEYDSEDPLLAGKIAAAMVRGIQSRHIAATVKHFDCNNKETNRKNSDSRLSQRALREIYLRAFEIVVREAEPWAIMSSYNIINGRRASECRELLTDILRDEWGYTGVVMTDWWTRGEHYKELLAGNDLKMANGYPERVRRAMDLGLVSRADLEVCARRILELILKID